MKHTPKTILPLLLCLLLTACSPRTVPQETATVPLSEMEEISQEAHGRAAFVEALLSQTGSAGEILGTGQRYAAWFARRQNYRVEPWEDENVAWCVCFLYWGIDQIGDYVTFDFDDPGIRTADVDLLYAYFTDTGRRTDDPKPGDLIFFDTDPEDTDPTVNHAGAVAKVDASTIYIIEGNTLRGPNHPTGTAQLLSYPPEDPRILGYGVLDWK